MIAKLEKIYGTEIVRRVEKASVLVVGAGGIGCELVKAMSMSGFNKIDVLDQDTIDISNLNRQFLFRRIHVGKSKSTCLAASILEQNPKLAVTAHEGRIQEHRFGFTFF